MSIFRHNCEKHGHCFEPRYNEIPSGYSVERAQGTSLEGLRNLMILKVYIHDVCKFCGRIVKEKTHD